MSSKDEELRRIFGLGDKSEISRARTEANIEWPTFDAEQLLYELPPGQNRVAVASGTIGVGVSVLSGSGVAAVLGYGPGRGAQTRFAHILIEVRDGRFVTIGLDQFGPAGLRELARCGGCKQVHFTDSPC